MPEERFDGFWRLVRAALRPGGRVFLVDSSAGDRAHTGRAAGGERELRQLSDGREFEIVKRRWQPRSWRRASRPSASALELAVSANGHFIYGGGQ